MMTARSVARSVRHLAPLALTALALAGVLVRLTTRDAVDVVAPLYYATPPAILAVFLAGAALLWGRRGRRRASLVALACAALLVGWQGEQSIVRSAPSGPEPAIPVVRGVLWNVAHGAYGWPHVAAELRDHAPDLMLLNETGRRPGAFRRVWHEHFGEYQGVWLPGHMGLLVRGSVERVESLTVRNGHAALARVRVNGLALAVVAVDLEAHPLRSRRSALTDLAAHGRALADEPALMLGDFNTPRDSALFGRLRADFAHGFEVAGAGYGATWPVPLPVLALDHVWASRRVKVLSVEHGWSWASDHRPVKFTFTIDAGR